MSGNIKPPFALPLSRARLNGVLTLYQDNGTRAPVLALQENTQPGKPIWLLHDGDVVKTPVGDIAVKHFRAKTTYLNNRVGTLFNFKPCAHYAIEKRSLEMMPDAQVSYFLGACPVADKEDLLILLDACFFKRSVTLAPAAQPLAQPSNRFATGYLRGSFVKQSDDAVPVLSSRTPVDDRQLHRFSAGDKLIVMDFHGSKPLWAGEITPSLLDSLRESLKEPDQDKKNLQDLPANVLTLQHLIYQRRPAVLKKAKPFKAS